MDILTLDLRVHEVESEGLTTFYIVKKESMDPVNDHVAVLRTSTADADDMRSLAHLMANAPDMQRTGKWHLEQKRYADPALFKNLHFTEVSAEEFEAIVNDSDGSTGTELRGDIDAEALGIPDRMVTDFPATYDHATSSDQGIADTNIASVDAYEEGTSDAGSDD